MPAGGLIALYGQPGIGKSFLALDFAMSIGAGHPWQHRAVKSGPVLYIAAEGGTGMSKRSKAWLLDKSLTSADTKVMWLLESIPIYGDSQEVDRVMERIIDEVQVKPRMVVIDTLARCFDGNENEQEDMGRFVAGADRFRTEFECAVMVVHHTRLDGDRERGNTAFRGAADTMLSIQEKKGSLILSCNKQKDAEEFKDIELIMMPVPSADSLVIHGSRNRASKMLATTDLVLDILKANVRLTFTAWSLACTRQGISAATFKRRVESLKQTGEISNKNGQYELTTP
jgi:hypothetical protein